MDKSKVPRFYGPSCRSQVVNSSSSSSFSGSDGESTYWLDDPCSSFDFFYNTVYVGLGLTLFVIATH